MRHSVSVVWLLVSVLLFVQSAAFLVGRTRQAQPITRQRRLSSLFAYDDDDDDDDDEIDPDSLGDWRAFRRSLATTEATTQEADSSSPENELVLRTQNEALAKEYKTVWAHETSTVRACFESVDCTVL